MSGRPDCSRAPCRKICTYPQVTDRQVDPDARNVKTTSRWVQDTSIAPHFSTRGKDVICGETDELAWVQVCGAGFRWHLDREQSRHLAGLRGGLCGSGFGGLGLPEAEAAAEGVLVTAQLGSWRKSLYFLSVTAP
jgi:hypothetical protein